MSLVPPGVLSAVTTGASVARDETEQMDLEPGPQAWRTPALLALVLLVAGAGLLWAAGHMTPPAGPPEVVATNPST